MWMEASYFFSKTISGVKPDFRLPLVISISFCSSFWLFPIKSYDRLSTRIAKQSIKRLQNLIKNDAIATYAFLYSWNEYLYAVLFLSGETNITIPVANSCGHGQLPGHR
jgi:hypothetical protein